MKSDDPLHSFEGITFGGIDTSQLWVDFFLWERLLNLLPETRAVLELGTNGGGFSLYLQSQCDIRGMEFHTFDSTSPIAEDKLHNFHEMHIFLERREVIDIMNSFGGPIILLCDNGNKQRELETFSGRMPDGSVVAVHDWGTEILPEHIPDWLDEIMGEFCDTIGSATRLFISKGER